MRNHVHTFHGVCCINMTVQYSQFKTMAPDQVFRTGISNCIPQNTVGCNYISLLEILQHIIMWLGNYDTSAFKVIPSALFMAILMAIHNSCKKIKTIRRHYNMISYISLYVCCPWGLWRAEYLAFLLLKLFYHSYICSHPKTKIS